jgi:hypothetical protein
MHIKTRGRPQVCVLNIRVMCYKVQACENICETNYFLLQKALFLNLLTFIQYLIAQLQYRGADKSLGRPGRKQATATKPA